MFVWFDTIAAMNKSLALPQLRSDSDGWQEELSRLDVGEVRLGRHDRTLYATDASIYQAMPLAVKQAALGQAAFLYLFDHGYPAADALGLHGFHAAEIPYVFGTRDKTPPAWPKAPDSRAERRLEVAILGYWVGFVKDGAPSAAGEPVWPNYGAGRSHMAFEDTPVAKFRLMPGMYELHEELVRRRRAQVGIPWNWNVGIVSPVLPQP